jgi:hypothetical protein
VKKITIGLLTLLGLFCLSAKVMAQEAFTEGLVLYLPLDEDEGEEAIDASGNGNNGTISGCEWIDEGKFKGALKFSANSSINIPGSESLMIQDEITLSLWFFYEEKGELEQRGMFQADAWNLDLHNSIGRIEINTGEAYHGCVNSTPPTTGEWHFIAGTYDKSAMKFYMDGLKTSECPLAGKINAPGTNIVIGSTGWGPAMVGIYDDIRIYKIAFLEEEIRDLYEYVPEELSVNPHISIPATWAAIKGGQE